MIATAEHIISVIHTIAEELGRTPTSYELRRRGGISPAVVKYRFGSYMAAVRAAGMEPQAAGVRVSDAKLLEDWGRVVRKQKQVPSGSQYAMEGRYSITCFRRHFQRWGLGPAAFVLAAQRGGLSGDWSDVLETVRAAPIPARGGGWWRKVEQQKGRHVSAGQPTAEQAAQAAGGIPLPPPLVGKKCVTATMLTVLVASIA